MECFEVVASLELMGSGNVGGFVAVNVEICFDVAVAVELNVVAKQGNTLDDYVVQYVVVNLFVVVVVVVVVVVYVMVVVSVVVSFACLHFAAMAQVAETMWAEKGSVLIFFPDAVLSVVVFSAATWLLTDGLDFQCFAYQRKRTTLRTSALGYFLDDVCTEHWQMTRKFLG